MNKEYAIERKKGRLAEASETILTNLPLLICGIMLALAMMHDLFV
jgi:hypothetical protein